ncbi:MAG TPA: tyrosine-type recombinase/integrase [Ktedonobacterales bacterium]|nr:tyrosine-type recombinase/integrase [Ktedonobacterales bacterium]
MRGKRRGNGEGTIYKRTDGRWAAQVTLADGTRKTVYAKTRLEVQRELTAIKRSLDIGMPVRRDERMPLADWLAYVRFSIKPLTHARYGQLIRHVPAATLGRTALTKVTPAQLEHLYAELLASGLSSTTVHQLHSVLHHALGDAIRKGLLARNVCDLVDAPTPRRVQVRALTVEQARAVLAAAADGERLEALYVLALTTGLRQGELLALHWADVDLEASVVQVRGTLHRVPGVSVSAKTGLVISDPKTQHSRRPVRLSAVAVQALRTHRARQLEERLALGEAWHDLDLVFCNSIGRPCEARNVIRTSYVPLLERAGVPHIKFHALRHSAATLLLSQGIHPKIVAEMLGHTTISMTLDIYSHVALDMQQEAADTMDRLFRA